MSERRQEEEYFDRIEREKKEKLRKKLDIETKHSERRAEMEVHWHRCGKCGASMDTKPYRGVDIEVCPQCGAVLLDAGELEKLAGKDQSGVLDGIKALFGG